MPALPPVPKTLQIRLVYNDGGDADIQNILYFKYGGTASAPDLVTLAQEVKTVWGTHMAGQHSNTLHLLSVFIDDLDSATGAQAVDGNPALTASNVSGPLTSGVAFVMSNVGQMKYRGGHSRTYLPGIPTNAAQDPNTWTTAFQTAMLTAWQGFIAAIVSAAPTAIQLLGQVIAHRFGASATAPVGVSSGRSARSVPLTHPVVENVVGHRTNPQVGSQRRRNLQQG